MGFFAQLLLGRPRTREQVGGLTLDADEGRLAGLGRGDSRAVVEERLGPPARLSARRSGALEYPSLGAIVYLDEARTVRGFVIYGQPLDLLGARFEAFAGTCTPGRDGHLPDAAALTSRWGPPTARDEDEEATCLEWDHAGLHRSADFDSAGRLTELAISFD